MPYSWQYCASNSTSSEAVQITSLRIGTTVPATALTMMQYRFLPLELAPLCHQQHLLWSSTGYFPYSWHQCTNNSTSSDAVLVTSLTVGTTAPATTLALKQYRLLPLELAPLCQQQHQLWSSTGYFPYSWQQFTNNSTSSDAVLDTNLTVGTIVPVTALALKQCRLLTLQLAPLCQQQH